MKLVRGNITKAADRIGWSRCDYCIAALAGSTRNSVRGARLTMKKAARRAQMRFAPDGSTLRRVWSPPPGSPRGMCHPECVRPLKARAPKVPTVVSEETRWKVIECIAYGATRARAAEIAGVTRRDVDNIVRALSAPKRKVPDDVPIADVIDAVGRGGRR